MTISIGVVGGGIMGSGIAETCARQGSPVRVVELDPQRAAGVEARVRRSVERAVASGKLSEERANATLGAIEVETDLRSLSDRNLVIEAITEDESAKTAVFRELDEVVDDPAAILASNTSSIPIMKLAACTSRPKNVIGLHFFNPVPVMKLVELVPSLITSEDTTARCDQFVSDTLGKHAIRCEDRAGFIVNSLLVPYILAAVRMFESGFATMADIDTGMVEGCGHPMGPLALCDLIGLDTVAAVAQSLYEEFKEPLYAPPPLLSRMVDAGLLGRKAGRGFYGY